MKNGIFTKVSNFRYVDSSFLFSFVFQLHDKGQ